MAIANVLRGRPSVWHGRLISLGVLLGQNFSIPNSNSVARCARHCGCVCLELRVHGVCDILCVVDAAAAVPAWSASCAQGRVGCYSELTRPATRMRHTVIRGAPCAVPALCPPCAKGRLFFTIRSHGPQGADFYTLQPLRHGRGR